MKRMDKPAGETRNFTQLPPLHAKSGMNKKNAVMVLSLLFLVGALGVGVFLVNQNQNTQTPAQSLEDRSALDSFKNLVNNQVGDQVVPGDPAIPGDPGAGDIPIIPGDGDEPGDPGTGIIPGDPVIPGDPGTGKIPEVPVVPGDPDDPKIPEDPSCKLQVSVTCQGCSGN